MIGVKARCQLELIYRLELLQSVGPTRIEQAIVGCRAINVRCNERLRDQISDVANDIRRRQCVSRHDGNCRFRSEPSGKDTEATQDYAQRLRKQRITPVQGCAEGLVTRRRRPAAALEQFKTIIEVVRYTSDAQTINTACRQFDGQRNAIEPAANFAHDWPEKPRGYHRCVVRRASQEYGANNSSTVHEAIFARRGNSLTR